VARITRVSDDLFRVSLENHAFEAYRSLADAEFALRHLGVSSYVYAVTEKVVNLDDPWPGMGRSREIIADYVGQFEAPFPPGTPLPEDPTPGAED
jgi:hypothetical protein